MSHSGVKCLGGAVAVVAFCCSFMVVQTAAAQSVESFYKGKTINVYIGYGAGGGFDFYGRLFARYVGRHIPGQPSIVPQNMPGAGSLRAANFVYNAAAKDGTSLGVVTPALALEDAFQSNGVQYKAAEFAWIGRLAPSMDIVMSWHTSKAKTIDDVFKLEVPIAGSGAGSTAEMMPRVLNSVVGTKFKVITGYDGSNQAMLAMERGEVDASTVGWNTVATAKRDWVTNKSVNLLVQLAPYRHKDVPDVPNMVELGKTEEQRQILSVYASGAEIGRSVFGSPGIPAERVKALRDAFDAMIKDPAFLAEVEKTKTELDPLPGAELQKVVEAATQIPADIREKARKARPE